MPLRHPLPFPPIHPPQILLIGATTYIGGTVLATLLDHPGNPLKSTTIACLVHNHETASTLLRAYGEDVNLIIQHDLNDTELTTLIASKHDVVINCTPAAAADVPSTTALIEGLAQRKKKTGRDVWFFHTSSTEILVEISVKWYLGGGTKEFVDESDDIYGNEATQEADHSHPQRVTDLAVMRKGLELGVKTLSIMNPMVFGRGTGLFERNAAQFSAMVKSAMTAGKKFPTVDGKGIFDHVHVQELAQLYTIVVLRMMTNDDALLQAKSGILFSANGRHRGDTVTQEAADVLFREGLLPQKEPSHAELMEAIKLFTSCDPEALREEELSELCQGGNVETRSTIAQSLGWNPSQSEETWFQAIQDEVRILLQHGSDKSSDIIYEP